MTKARLIITACATIALGAGVFGCASKQTGDAALVDRTPPRVISANPDDDAENVPVNQEITVVFSKRMNAGTVNADTFTLTKGVFNRVDGTVTYAGTEGKFVPKRRLPSNTKFYVTIRADVRDLAGNRMFDDVSWTFRTGSDSATTQRGIALGDAGDFAVLAEEGVATSGKTMVHGNIGLSPGTGSEFTGFSTVMDSSNHFATSTHVTGRMYAAEYAPPTPVNVVKAMRDMRSAYSISARREMPHAKNLGNGSIDKMTLPPGLYRWDSDLAIENSVTLKGNSKDVWVFQVEGDLIVSDGATVSLVGGAHCDKIIWQVGGETTLGINSKLTGLVLGRQTITLKSGSVLTGRAFSQESVALHGATVNCPE
jgi:hypothetical protein